MFSYNDSEILSRLYKIDHSKVFRSIISPIPIPSLKPLNSNLSIILASVNLSGILHVDQTQPGWYCWQQVRTSVEPQSKTQPVMCKHSHQIKESHKTKQANSFHATSAFSHEDRNVLFELILFQRRRENQACPCDRCSAPGLGSSLSGHRVGISALAQVGPVGNLMLPLMAWGAADRQGP